MKVRIVGAGRAGRSFELALSEAGVDVDLLRGRSSLAALAGAAHGVDVLLLAVPDRHVAALAKAIDADPVCTVMHCSGSLGLEALEPHERRASLHPLATLPDPVVGSLRLRGGAFFAVSGDQVATDLALALGGQPIVVDPTERARYHAAACIASNHLVALLGQVQRIAGEAGLPLEAFLPLARGALDDVTMLGPAEALTGPASRGDHATIEAHRGVIDPSELSGYDAGVALARRLAAHGDEATEPEPLQPAVFPAATQADALDLVTERGDWRSLLDSVRGGGRVVGLVPTMGALHEGHLSLLRAAREQTGFVAMTLFVNPLQFGEASDLEAYPRDLGADLRLADEGGVDAVFAPSVAEMYPSGPPTTRIDPGRLATILEGASRPGHFEGVAVVVTKLFALSGSVTAFFGEKDYQQLVIVRRLAIDLDLPVEVVGCPIVRDDDGVALSSRNRRLAPDERRAAAALPRALEAGRRTIENGAPPAAGEAAMAEVLAAEPLVQADYAVALDAATLEPPGHDGSGPLRLLVAAVVGSVRLIDNMPVAP